MRKPRPTIAQWMALIAILAVNAALFRAFVVDEMFIGGILILIALQLGLGCYFRRQGRVRRFWLGFEVAGMASVLVLFSCELLPDLPLNRLVMSYTDFAVNVVSAHIPTRGADYLLDDRVDVFLAVVYFLPELIAALVGGMIAAFALRTSVVTQGTGGRLPVRPS
jgi:hypothetical protein